MPEAFKFPRPVMGTAAGFHADKAGGKFGKKRTYHRAAYLFADDYAPFLIYSVSLKNVFCAMKSDGGNVHGGWFSFHEISNNSHYGASDADSGGRPHHYF